MSTTTVTVGTKGQLLLPPEVAEQLHLRPGARLTITIEQWSTSSPASPSHSRNSLMGIFAGGPSLEGDYFRDKDKDKW